MNTEDIFVASYSMRELNPISSTLIVGGVAVLPRTEIPFSASCVREFFREHRVENELLYGHPIFSFRLLKMALYTVMSVVTGK